MERWEKITKTMASLVVNLTKGNCSTELTEQPDIIPGHLKMTKYQMIG
jgi:hypothetical protein